MSTLSIMAPALIDTASNWDNLGVLKWKAGKKLQKLDFKYSIDCIHCFFPDMLPQTKCRVTLTPVSDKVFYHILHGSPYLADDVNKVFANAKISKERFVTNIR